MKINPFTFRFLLWLVFACCALAFTSDAPKNQYTIPIAAWSVSAADLDLDGDMDLLVGHKTAWQQTNKTISVLTNLDNGNFIISDTSKNYCGYQENIFAIKIDSDNYPDIVTFYSDFSSGIKKYVRVWYNENGSFNNFIDFNLNNSAIFSDITYGDVNADNLLDIIVLSNSGRFFGILENIGNGILATPTYYFIPNYPPVDIACGDLNNDGRDDVVICGQYVEVFISTSTGFQKIYTDLDGIKNKLSISDFNRDGWNDIIASADLLNTEWTNIYQNTGSGSFTKLEDHFITPGATSLLIKDFNNDTLPDIAYLLQYPMTNPDTIGGINIVYNLGDFQLSDPVHINLPCYYEGWRHFTSADLDGNGFNDFAVVRTLYVTLANNLELLFNDGEGNFVPDPLVDIAERPKIKPQLFCYPNPFHNNTTFKYYIEKPSQIELVVYTLNGQLISILTNQTENAGLHTVTWNTQNHAYGTCIACLRLNGKAYKTMKIIGL